MPGVAMPVTPSTQGDWGRILAMFATSLGQRTTPRL